MFNMEGFVCVQYRRFYIVNINSCFIKFIKFHLLQFNLMHIYCITF